MMRVTVVGGGNLGVKIAGELAYHGHEVRLYDRSPETLDRVQLRIKEDKRLLTEDGLLLSPNFLGEVYYISRLEDAVKSSDFVFEAVSEDLPLKQDLFEWISHCCKPDAVISTSTMTFDADAVAERAVNKERCLGVRFLYPVYCIPEVEIVPGKLTSISTLEKVRIFLSRMGKVAFFRSGDDPLVLTEEQRESKKLAFIQQLKENRGTYPKSKKSIPDLANKQILSNGVITETEKNLQREKDCVVCMDEERNCVLHPCHHLCTCATCGRMLLKRQDACPICRKHISSVFRVYHS